jgi:hypothetical protein
MHMAATALHFKASLANGEQQAGSSNLRGKDMQREIAMLQAQLDRVTSRMHELEQLIWEDRGVAPDVLLQRLRERERVTARMHELEQLIWEDRGVAPDILLQRLREREHVRALDKGLTSDDLSGDSSSSTWPRAR